MTVSDGIREVSSEAELRDMKAFMRSNLWDPAAWNPGALPAHPRLVKSVQPTEETLEELERHYGPSYAKGLYG